MRARAWSIHLLLGLASIVGACAGSDLTPPEELAAASQPEEPWQREPPPPPLAAQGEARDTEGRVHRFELLNGLSVVAQERRHRPIVSVRLLFGSGYTSDPSDQLGSTYFGVTLLGDLHEETRDGGPIHGEKSLSRQIWEKGGRYHSFVSADSSGIGLDGYARDLASYFEILAQAVRDPRRGEETFVQRRDGLIHELEELTMSDEVAFASLLRQIAFGVDHPYGRFAFGTIRSLKRLGHREIVKQQQRLLNPRTSTLVIVGDFDATKLEIALARNFGRWRGQGAPLRADPKLPRPSKKRRHLLIPQPFPETMGICGALPLGTPSKAAVEVLAELLGGNFQSRLGEVLRVKHGLAYSFFSEVTEQKRASALQSCTRVARAGADQALRLFIGVLESFATEPAEDDALLRAKASIRARLSSRHESVQTSMQTWVDDLGKADLTPIESRLSLIEAVTAADVQRVAQELDLANSMRFILTGDAVTARRAAKGAGLGALERVGGSL